jgi:hypothetical protein
VLTLLYSPSNILIQPMRCKHCPYCERCILKRDHHCPWVLNCLGYNNYKTFFMMQIYVWTTCFFILGYYWQPLYTAVANKSTSLGMLYLISLEFCLTLGLGITLLYFNIFHIWLICKGYTTTEYNFEYKKEKNNPRSNYNISCCKNFRSVFGERLIEWILPFSMFIIRSI